MARFRADRRANIRSDRRDVTIAIAGTIGLAVWVAVASGWQQTFAAFLLGCYVTMLFVLWLIGFDARSLVWRWGAVGEEWTAKELARLGADWRVYHDLADGQGNWDHIAVGPHCVFVIDSKNLRGTIRVGADGGRAGRLPFGGAASRGSAARLGERLEAETGVKVWVQAVVAVWGDFATVVERENVLYVPGAAIASELERFPRKFRDDQRPRVVAALDKLTV